MKTTRRGRRGVTLIELMVTIVILSIGVVGIISALGHGVDEIRRIRNMSTAANLLQEKMEIVRNTDFADLSTITDATIAQLNNGLYSVDVVNYGGSTDIERVTVTVSWTLSGQRVSRSLTTLVTRGGINP